MALILPVFWIELDGQVARRAKALARRGQKGGMHGLVKELALDAALLFHVIQHSNKFLAHNSFQFFPVNRPRWGKKRWETS